MDNAIALQCGKTLLSFRAAPLRRNKNAKSGIMPLLRRLYADANSGIFAIDRAALLSYMDDRRTGDIGMDDARLGRHRHACVRKCALPQGSDGIRQAQAKRLREIFG